MFQQSILSLVVPHAPFSAHPSSTSICREAEEHHKEADDSHTLSCTEDASTLGVEDVHTVHDCALGVGMLLQEAFAIRGAARHCSAVEDNGT